MHVVDFLQHRGDMGALAREMGEHGCTRAVAFGLPVKKHWARSEPEKPTYYLDDNAPCHYHSLTDVVLLDAVDELERAGIRVAPLASGFAPTDRLAGEHLEHLWERSERWAGVGEVMLRHDDLTDLTAGETPTADHIAMDVVADFCRDKNVPLLVHHDSSSPGRPGRHEYVAELDRLLRRHPGTSVVWAHGGVSRRIDPRGQAEMLDELTRRHPRLHVDLSWVLLDRILDGGRLDDRWTDVLRRRPDRFVVGTDTVGRADMFADRARQIAVLLDCLGPVDAEYIATANAASLWFRE
ncbi:hypothetical protein Rrhod_0160 [Rhodococcus rhodnii LMG 5362]|uniref:Amidohydrolase-related domain-containing protein n=1 Tax=Rhodococcus rhodnii LMG 5362 TaxID=1273125 RepID=R7WSU2_9NOCA|nr:hypothetical protein Rrhod_0160 [Rhodococcus rhodnii LMG 5362]